MNEPESTPIEDQTNTRRTARLTSIDVFRGGVMFLMLAEVLHLCHVAEAFPDSAIAQWLCHHQTHVAWRGCSIHDLIQPGFSFLVGTALAFSVASRRRRGRSDRGLLLHAAWRVVVLSLLGVFLRSLHREQTYWTFEDTLTQIGLGYLPLVVIAVLPRWTTWLAIGVILIGCFAAFAMTPLPADGFDMTTVGVPQDWEHLETGFAAHWNKNTNLAMQVEQWFLNQFPREEKFSFSPGGYATLSFIPTLATMLLGLLAGRWLRDESSVRTTLTMLFVAALACLALGYALDATGICISVKRIWTPSWVLVSGGWCFLILAVLHVITDIIGFRKPADPIVVIGMNSIAAYVMSWFVPEFIKEAIDRHLGSDFKNILGEGLSTIVTGGITLLIVWLVLFWMHRRRLYLKI